MPSPDLAFERLLTKKIEEAMSIRAEQVLGGALTHEQYKYESGYLACLKEVQHIIADVHKSMFGEE